MPEQSLTEYPSPQQWYTINATALTWPELYRASGNPLTFVLSAPIMAVLKLLHVKLPSGRIPREISFQTQLPPLPPADAARVQRLLDDFAALGLRHFSTFRMPEIMGGTLMYALLDPQGRACADVTYMPARSTIYPEAFTAFADGASVTTVVHKAAVAVNTYPGKRISLANKATVAQLWESHLRSVAEMSPQHGGLQPLGEEELFTHLRDDIRRYVDFQMARGLLVPDAQPLPPPPSWP
jgi:hypothetical protein